MKCLQNCLKILFLCIYPLFASSQSIPTNHEIANALKREVENGRSNCIVVGIFDKGQEDFIAYGKPIEGQNSEATKETIFEIASITKVFVTTLMADLAVKGILSIDDPLIKYLPDSLNFKDNRIKQITLKHLATHTSGLSNLILKSDLKKLNEYRQNFSHKDLLAALEDYQLPYEPDTWFDYSNYNMGLIAYVICSVTNKDLDKLFQEIICRPLEMNNTSMYLSKEQEDYFATGYVRPGRPIEHLKWGTAEAGAAALRSNAQDLITFIRKLFYDDSPLNKAAKLSIITRFDSTKFQNTSIGLGWFITKRNNSITMGHGGSVDGFKSLLMYDTVIQRGIVVLSNSSREIIDIGLYLFGKKAVDEFTAIESKKINNQLWTNIEGKYSFKYGNIMDTIDIYRKDDLLFIYSPIAGEIEMIYLGKNSFQIADMKIRFDIFFENKAVHFIGEKGHELYGARIIK